MCVGGWVVVYHRVTAPMRLGLGLGPLGSPGWAQPTAETLPNTETPSTSPKSLCAAT